MLFFWLPLLSHQLSVCSLVTFGHTFCILCYDINLVSLPPFVWNWLICTKDIMTLISIGRTQLLPASSEQSPAHAGLGFAGVCCPLVQGHCQFLPLFPPSSLCPSYRPVGCLPLSKATLHTHSPHLGCKFLGGGGCYDNIPKSAAAPPAARRGGAAASG